MINTTKILSSNYACCGECCGLTKCKPSFCLNRYKGQDQEKTTIKTIDQLQRAVIFTKRDTSCLT